MKKFFNKMNLWAQRIFYNCIEGKLASVFLGFGILLVFIQPLSGLLLLGTGSLFLGLSIYDNVKFYKKSKVIESYAEDYEVYPYEREEEQTSEREASSIKEEEAVVESQNIRNVGGESSTSNTDEKTC